MRRYLILSIEQLAIQIKHPAHFEAIAEDLDFVGYLGPESDEGRNLLVHCLREE